jgi:hypothetical protein
MCLPTRNGTSSTLGISQDLPSGLKEEQQRREEDRQWDVGPRSDGVPRGAVEDDEPETPWGFVAMDQSHDRKCLKRRKRDNVGDGNMVRMIDGCHCQAVPKLSRE